MLSESKASLEDSREQEWKENGNREGERWKDQWKEAGLGDAEAAASSRS